MRIRYGEGNRTLDHVGMLAFLVRSIEAEFPHAGDKDPQRNRLQFRHMSFGILPWQPPLQCVKQVGATFFKRTAGCPDSAKRFDFRVKTLSVVYHFISRLGKKRVYKILYHRPMISQKRLPFTLRG